LLARIIRRFSGVCNTSKISAQKDAYCITHYQRRVFSKIPFNVYLILEVVNAGVTPAVFVDYAIPILAPQTILFIIFFRVKTSVVFHTN
jgi:hypothetical protein